MMFPLRSRRHPLISDMVSQNPMMFALWSRRHPLTSDMVSQNPMMFIFWSRRHFFNFWHGLSESDDVPSLEQEASFDFWQGLSFSGNESEAMFLEVFLSFLALLRVFESVSLFSEWEMLARSTGAVFDLVMRLHLVESGTGAFFFCVPCLLVPDWEPLTRSICTDIDLVMRWHLGESGSGVVVFWTLHLLFFDWGPFARSICIDLGLAMGKHWVELASWALFFWALFLEPFLLAEPTTFAFLGRKPMMSTFIQGSTTSLLRQIRLGQMPMQRRHVQALSLTSKTPSLTDFTWWIFLMRGIPCTVLLPWECVTVFFGT